MPLQQFFSICSIFVLGGKFHFFVIMQCWIGVFRLLHSCWTALPRESFLWFGTLFGDEMGTCHTNAPCAPCYPVPNMVSHVRACGFPVAVMSTIFAVFFKPSWQIVLLNC
ncbi:unnamed protein product [Ostreobium quekettii]|uniref:Uncharacterized protein n=1 Tax=Ostreobium quekettii TaxID=121088 RepID=A0A8S1IYU7_9CHLO|nr:unnamed protein product [Ostreobium quekettii]